MKPINNTYNVLNKGRVVFTGVRYDCERYIADNKLNVELVDEPNFAIHVSGGAQ